MQKWEIKHKTFSPTYAQSNGFIERQVQTQSIKKILKKAVHDGKDMSMTLLEYRTTSLNREISSPAELLYNRKLKGQLYMVKKSQESKKIVNQYKLKKKQKIYYDKGEKERRERTELKVNQIVMLLNNKKEWEAGLLYIRLIRIGRERIMSNLTVVE